jgi:hypothetical protein
MAGAVAIAEAITPAVSSVTVNTSDVSEWFGRYVDAFAACCRGEADTASLLAFYGVPLVITSDAGSSVLTSGEQVTAMMQRQVDDMLAADYEHSEILDSEVTVLNAVSALYRGLFSRHRRDGGEFSRFTVTYFITEGTAGRRIAVLAAHGSR